MRGDVPNRLVVSSRDSPMTPPPWVGNGIIRVERIRTRARAGPRARDDRDDRVRLVDDRAADVASERSSSRVESSRVERVTLDWKRPHRVRIARSGSAGRVGDGGDDGAGGRARGSRGDARGETTRGGGRVEAREGGEDAGELAGRVGG